MLNSRVTAVRALGGRLPQRQVCARARRVPRSAGPATRRRGSAGTPPQQCGAQGPAAQDLGGCGPRHSVRGPCVVLERCERTQLRGGRGGRGPQRRGGRLQFDNAEDRALCRTAHEILPQAAATGCVLCANDVQLCVLAAQRAQYARVPPPPARTPLPPPSALPLKRTVASGFFTV